jgi:hypothetical protein
MQLMQPNRFRTSSERIRLHSAVILIIIRESMEIFSLNLKLYIYMVSPRIEKSALFVFPSHKIIV